MTGHTEGVRVVYNPKEVSFVDIMRMFWESHDPTQYMGQGNDRGSQYRSGFYYFNEEQKRLKNEAALKLLEEEDEVVDEAARENAVACKSGLVFIGAVGAVEFANVRGLGFKVSRPRHGELHARGEFVAGNARGEIGVIREVDLVLLFQYPQGGSDGFVFGLGNSLWPF